MSSGTTESGTFDAQDRLLTYGTLSYTYGANGELESKTDAGSSGSTLYTYDARGSLRSVALPNGDVLDYVIDGQSHRVGKKLNGALTQAFLYKDQLRIAAELTSAGTIAAQFTYLGQNHSPDYMSKGGVLYRLVKDQVGSVRLVVNASTGAVAQALDYDEFGRVLSDSNPGFQPFGFAGGLYDTATGLVRFGARDYDAVTGRWTSKDPVRWDGGQGNFYVYASQDMINRIDPSGELFCNLTSTPILVGGGPGQGKGHSTPGAFAQGWVWPGQCVGPTQPLHTDNGDLYDVDVADFNGDGRVEPPQSWRDLWPFGEKIPWGDEAQKTVCAVDRSPLCGSTPDWCF